MAVVKKTQIDPGVDDLFSTPHDVNTGDSIKIADIEDSLVVIRADEDGEITLDTKLGEADALPAEILVVDGDGASPEWQRILLFGVVLKRQAEAALKTGKPLVGVVGKGEAKPGKSAPWMIMDATPAQMKAAREAFIKANAPF